MQKIKEQKLNSKITTNKERTVGSEIFKSVQGITLIALVITIIVMLILASIVINLTLSDNGIFTKAKEARDKTGRETIIERTQTEVLEQQLKNEGKNITKVELKTILDKYFKLVPDDYTIETVLETKEEYGKYQISVSEIYKGEFAETEGVISKTESFIGYYADLDGDGEVEGIIYADLATGFIEQDAGYNGWDNYDKSSVPVIKNTKNYCISQQSYNGNFGNNPVLTALDEGAERFYVMSLKDLENSNKTYSFSNILKCSTVCTTSEFGSGKDNTNALLNEKKEVEVWQNLINPEIENGCFIPSIGEWRIFGKNLKIEGDYKEQNLSECYWSSTQDGTVNAWIVDRATISYTHSGSPSCNIRLSIKF